MIAKRLNQDARVFAAATLAEDGATPLDVAIDAATAGGFDGLSLWASSYLNEQRNGISDQEMRDRLDAANLRVDHVEAVIAWAGPDDPGAPYAEESSRHEVFAAAQALHAPVVSVLLFGTRSASEDDAADVFATIAHEASSFGLSVALEFALGTVIRDVASAGRVTSGPNNGGILYDTWLAHYGPSTIEDLAALHGDQILAIQVNDGAEERPDDYGVATRRRRTPLGEGAFLLPDMVRTLRAIGCDAPLTVEVFNDDLVRELGPKAFAHLLAGGWESLSRKYV